MVQAEERLRAHGMTGARAFDALVLAVRARMGDPVQAEPVALDAVRELPLSGGVDLLGLAYEHFFSDLFKGKRGQYFTPRPLVDLLLAVADAGPGDTVLDPTCGSGGFLVVAGRRGARVRGIERDPHLAALASLNLRLAGVDGEVTQADFFASTPHPVDVVVANPPFSVPIRDPEILSNFELARGRRRVVSDWLFVEALERWVRPGGRAAIVLPWTILLNPSCEPLRERLIAAWEPQAVCGLPEGVFRPFGGAAGRACLLWLIRRPSAWSGPPRWAELRDPGYDVRSQRYRATSGTDVARLIAGEGWTPLPPGAWVPGGVSAGRLARPLAALAQRTDRRIVPSRTPEALFAVTELADTDKTTGEAVTPQVVTGRSIIGTKASFAEGEILVSKLRPELGNVAIARRPAGGTEPLVGSTEWVSLRATRWPHYLLHAMRTPAWRAQLSMTGGQTRPRTSGDAVLASQVPWPGEPTVEKIDALARRLHDQRAALRERMLALQRLLDAYASGEISAQALDEGVLTLATG
jgi:protein-L-isoaspartate O-methyltransferase